jgi:hypothetical protein
MNRKLEKKRMSQLKTVEHWSVEHSAFENLKYIES